MATTTGDFELTVQDLRAVTAFAASFAEDVLPVFESACEGDPRPRAAIDAALTFVHGAPRTRLQRVTAFDAHRAAKEAPDEASRLAAQAAGDAAGSAYLHPLADARQVGHILRAAACAAHIAELRAGGDATASDRVVSGARDRATPALRDVLRRYPRITAGSTRASQLMATLDGELRSID